MAIKPNGEMCHIKEQIIEDLVTELTFQFKHHDNGSCSLYIYGDNLPHGNRDLFFDKNGEHAGSGTGMCKEFCKPSWLQEVKDKENDSPNEEMAKESESIPVNLPNGGGFPLCP